MGKVTIKDVAREAGVSISTVSNTLNNSSLVNEKTKEKVMEVVTRLNYVPNINGRLLKSSKSNLLGLVTSSINGPYFYKLVDAMYRECEKRGYGLNVLVSRDTQAVMNNILGESLDGFFIFEGCRVGDTEIAQIERSHVKALFLDRDIKREYISSVTFDSFRAGYNVARYLINLGHRRLVFIAGADDVYDSQQRMLGVKVAMNEFGLDFDEERDVVKGLFEEQFTFNTISTMIRYQASQIPHAFVAGNDLSAIGCIKALQQNGYRVPEDVSVIGFDDIEVAEYFSPPLTTVCNPIARQGVLAVEMMFDMINQKKKGESLKLEGALVPRESCKINQSTM